LRLLRRGGRAGKAAEERDDSDRNDDHHEDGGRRREKEEGRIPPGDSPEAVGRKRPAAGDVARLRPLRRDGRGEALVATSKELGPAGYGQEAANERAGRARDGGDRDQDDRDLDDDHPEDGGRRQEEVDGRGPAGTVWCGQEAANERAGGARDGGDQDDRGLDDDHREDGPEAVGRKRPAAGGVARSRPLRRARDGGDRHGQLREVDVARGVVRGAGRGGGNGVLRIVHTPEDVGSDDGRVAVRRQRPAGDHAGQRRAGVRGHRTRCRPVGKRLSLRFRGEDGRRARPAVGVRERVRHRLVEERREQRVRLVACSVRRANARTLVLCFVFTCLITY